MMMRAFLLTLLALCGASDAGAQGAIRAVVPYAGYDYATKNGLAGVGVRLGLPLPDWLAVQPSVEGQFTGDDFVSRRLQGAVDVVAELPIALVTPYLGAGVAVVYRHTDRFGSDGGLGGNVFAGVALGRAPGPRPFVQLRYSATDIIEDGAVALTGGVVLGL